jgi:hypothetical protein
VADLPRASLAFIGASARALIGNMTTQTMDNAASFIALHAMPPILGGLLIAAVLGAVMATSLVPGARPAPMVVERRKRSPSPLRRGQVPAVPES